MKREDGMWMLGVGEIGSGRTGAINPDQEVIGSVLLLDAVCYQPLQ